MAANMLTLQRILSRRIYQQCSRSYSNGRPSAPTTSSNDSIDPLNKYTPFGNFKKHNNDIWHYSDRKAGTGYSNDSLYQHRPYIWPLLRKLYKLNYLLSFLLLFALGWNNEWLGQFLKDALKDFVPKAAQAHGIIESEENEDEASKSAEKDGEKPKKRKIGFRERRIIEYEDRIRVYSTPDKIFRYFATLKVLDKADETGRTFEVFMTPEDFMRSFTPGVMQPRKWGLDSFKVYNPQKYHHNFSDTKSIFYKLGENGLIGFSDYLFLMTLLSTSPDDFALAFKIFDINGDGALDKEEFQKVQQLIMSQTTVGQRHRDHITPNSSFKVESNSALEAYFFGKDGRNKLSAEKFLEFQKSLHGDILIMEFLRRDALDGIDGLISEENFANLLLMHAQIPDKRQKIMLKRVKRKFKGGPGINFDDTKNFFQFLYHIEDVEMALHFHRMAGLSVDGAMLKRVARKVTGVELSDHVIEIVVALFDDNMDGRLSNEEFVAVMRRRMRRGLERPRDTGLFRLVDALAICAKRSYHASPLPFY